MKIGFIYASALALVLAACSGNSQSSTSETPTPEAGNVATAMATAGAKAMHAMKGAGQSAGAMMATHTVTVVMKALNGSGESGQATLAGVGGKTRVTIKLEGENTTGKQPAHIHMGTCAKLNPAPKYVLSDVVLGNSITIVNAPIDSLTEGNMSINVHESAANLGKYVSCGTIPKK